ncbi:22351_t:CDS:2 [Racocetra persica]|uniref:22351_t:CDS:1 n=1 Tax=Racocetra persica TaxID=160502 RepID=A0ACA9L8K4_9GLOM|nr:22351_t:CDS:2 [Racocetra persica]
MGATPHPTYWTSLFEYYDALLASKYSIVENIRPVGHHAKRLDPTYEQSEILNNWVAEASLLDRLASAYYILVCIFVGISKAAGPCMKDNSLEDLPFILLLFIWTLPIIYVKIRNGKVVYKLSKRSFRDAKEGEEEFNDSLQTNQIEKIPVTAFGEQDLLYKQIYIAMPALVSITTPWLAVIIAYYTPQLDFSAGHLWLYNGCTFDSVESVSGHKFTVDKLIRSLL